MNRCLTDVYVMLHLIMLCQSAGHGVIKFFFTGLNVAGKSPCSSTCNMLIPMSTPYVALEVVFPAVTPTAAINWVGECTF